MYIVRLFLVGELLTGNLLCQLGTFADVVPPYKQLKFHGVLA